MGEHWPGCGEDTAQSSPWGRRGNRAGNRAEDSGGASKAHVGFAINAALFHPEKPLKLSGAIR